MGVISILVWMLALILEATYLLLPWVNKHLDETINDPQSTPEQKEAARNLLRTNNITPERLLKAANGYAIFGCVTSALYFAQA